MDLKLKASGRHCEVNSVSKKGGSIRILAASCIFKMAKGIKEIDITICDFCKENDTYRDKCLGCGKDVCFDCERNEIIFKVYPHSLFCNGSQDGAYCLECDDKYSKEYLADPVFGSSIPIPELWKKYRRMADLRKGYFKLVNKFKSEADLLEKSIEDEKKKFI